MKNIRRFLDKTIQKEIDAFVNLLLKNNINLQKVILFGSYAKKKASKYSDIDLAIVSSRFGKDEIQEMMDLKKLSLSVSDRIEAIPLNEKYFKSKYNPLIGEVKKYGRVVYEA